MKKRFLSVTVALCVAIALTLGACAANLSDGIHALDQTYRPVSDKRMYAEAPDYEGYVFVRGTERMNFRMKKPTVTEEGKTYPLVIFLHGAGDNGTDNRKHMYKSLIKGAAQYAPEECFVMLPQTPGDTDWTDGGNGVKGDGYGSLYNALLDAVMADQPIDADRIYLTGMSMGGFGTVYQAMTHPERYAAIMPLCGGSTWIDLTALADMPVWMAHSDDDPAVDPVFSHFLYAELLRLGNPNVRCTWYTDQGHQITQAFYSQPEVWTWLFSWRRS